MLLKVFEESQPKLTNSPLTISNRGEIYAKVLAGKFKCIVENIILN